MKMIIKCMDEGPQTVAVLDDYDGPVPRVGDSLFHPPYDDKDGTAELTLHDTNIAGSVKSVIWGLHARPRNGEDHFIKRPVPMVEIWI